MKEKNILSLLVLACMVLASVQVQAKLYTPDFERNFFNQINRHDLVVVHFNPYPEDEEDEQDLDRMKDGFFSLSKRDRYRDADVGFIGVNLEKLPELAEDYDIDVPDFDAYEAAEEKIDLQEDEDPRGIAARILGPKKQATDQDKAGAEVAGEEPETKPSQQSTLMLFKDGKPLKEKGNIVKRTGFMTKSEMEDFIEAYFGGYIDRILNEKKEIERTRERVRVARPRTVTRTVYRYPRRVRRAYYPGYYRRPYWGGYYGRPWGYGYGPRFGIGFGFGGRRGFGGRGFRGGFGFGW